MISSFVFIFLSQAFAAAIPFITWSGLRCRCCGRGHVVVMVVVLIVGEIEVMVVVVVLIVDVVILIVGVVLDVTVIYSIHRFYHCRHP